VRLGACNLHCTWCDTPYTWNSKLFVLADENKRRPVCSIVKQLAGMKVGLVVISGGEPLLQAKQPGFHNLVTWLLRRANVEVETNGTKMPPWWLLDHLRAAFNVSPKLSHAGDPEDKRIVPDVLQRLADHPFTDQVRFKFVVRCADDVAMMLDLAEIDQLVRRFKLRNVWVMPEGTTWRSQVIGLPKLADLAVDRGYNLSTRLHTLAWGSERAK
jgi:organic radical activating enzyme